MSLSQWTKQFSRVGRDGYHLARAIIQDTTTRRAVSFKPVLLEHARQANAVANSLLQVDKHVGLVRYYGILGYVKQRLQPALRTEDFNRLSTQSFATSSTTTSTARVAFMITASMKEELTDKLGYELDQVKQLTPLQASLVLHHRITAESFEEQLPLAEKEHQEHLARDERQRKLEIKEQEKIHEELEMKKQEQLKLQAIEKQQQQEQPQQQLSSGGSGSSSGRQPLRTVSGGSAFAYHSTNLLLSPTSDPENEFGSSWYEVIETNHETDVISRVGLYQDEREAILGMETRQDIADHKGRPLEFEMKSVEKSDVFSSPQ